MTGPTRTRAQIGKSSRRKGADFERAVANAIRPWFPEAKRSRDNGSTTTTDTGDIAGTWTGLWWSLKDDKSGAVDRWFDEAILKARNLVPLVVQKRAGCANPLRAWAWVRLSDLGWMVQKVPFAGPELLGWRLVRLEVRTVLDLLADAGHARVPLEDTA